MDTDCIVQMETDIFEKLSTENFSLANVNKVKIYTGHGHLWRQAEEMNIQILYVMHVNIYQRSINNI